MKRLSMTIALTCVFAISALAGEIPTVGIAPPPPNGTTQTIPAPSPGDIPTTDVADQTSSVALSALLTVLRLLGI